MPGMSGLEFLESLDSKPAVIITTAYRQYALEGFEHGVVDYLLKPFSFQRFCKAISRFSSFEQKDTGMSGSVSSLFTTPVDPIIIKTETGEEKIQPGDIQYIESLGNYIKINTQHQRYVIRETLAGFLLKLPHSHFLRVHRSFVVGVSYIDSFTGNSLRIGSRNIPVGNIYKADLRDVPGME
jgi:DNA-binding LytR/AlgR family response regulator